MQPVLIIALSNAIVATGLALLAAASRPLGRPALTHALWLLVLVKLVTPPLFQVPVRLATATPDPVSPPSPVERESVRPRMDGWPGNWPDQHVFVVEGQPAAPSALKPEVPHRAIASEADILDYEAPPDPNISPAASPGAPRHIPDATIPWPLLAALAWAIGSLACITLVLRRLIIFRNVLRHATLAPIDVQCQASLLARRLGMRRSPPVMILPGPLCPMLVALGSPRLLIPGALWSELDEPQRQSLLLHELAHLRRRDHWIRVLETLVTAAYWWLPTAWAARRALREAEEQCCDAWVLWAMPGPGGVRAYASALLETLDFTARHTKHTHVQSRPMVRPALASGLGEFHQLKRRLVMIKQAKAQRQLSWPAAMLVAGLMGALPLCPSVAQEPADDPVVAPPPPLVEVPAPPVPAGQAAAAAEELPGATPAPVAGTYEGGPYVGAGAASAMPRPGKASNNSNRTTTVAKNPLSEDDREELAEAQRQVREAEQELKKAVDNLARLQHKVAGKGPKSSPLGAPPKISGPRGKLLSPGPKNAPQDGLRGWTRWEPDQPLDINREMRLQALERQLAALLEEVRALRQESSARKKAVPSPERLPDPQPAKPSDRRQVR
jgi:beta-lactamase regulating signal transducer with metallopeptidase domain